MSKLFVLIKVDHPTEGQLQLKTMDQIENHWDRFSKLYDRQADSLAAATFQLWNMLRVREVESMVECGCGTGYLLPFLVEQKRPQSLVWAFDLSSEMVKLSIDRMRRHESLLQLPPSQPSGNALTQHFHRYNLIISKANSEDLKEIANESFEVFSSSLVLHLTETAERMLQEAHRVLKNGGRIGCSIWGGRANSNVMTILSQVLEENGVPLDKSVRSPFHMNDEKALVALFEKSNFKDILTWTSIIPFSILGPKDLDFILEQPRILALLKTLPVELQEKIKEDLNKSLTKILKEDRHPLSLEVMFIIGTKV